MWFSVFLSFGCLHVPLFAAMSRVSGFQLPVYSLHLCHSHSLHHCLPFLLSSPFNVSLTSCSLYSLLVFLWQISLFGFVAEHRGLDPGLQAVSQGCSIQHSAGGYVS